MFLSVAFYTSLSVLCSNSCMYISISITSYLLQSAYLIWITPSWRSWL